MGHLNSDIRVDQLCRESTEQCSNYPYKSEGGWTGKGFIFLVEAVFLSFPVSGTVVRRTRAHAPNGIHCAQVERHKWRGSQISLLIDIYRSRVMNDLFCRVPTKK